MTWTPISSRFVHYLHGTGASSIDTTRQKYDRMVADVPKVLVSRFSLLSRKPDRIGSNKGNPPDRTGTLQYFGEELETVERHGTQSSKVITSFLELRGHCENRERPVFNTAATIVLLTSANIWTSCDCLFYPGSFVVSIRLDYIHDRRVILRLWIVRETLQSTVWSQKE